jgi:HSP20 family protein
MRKPFFFDGFGCRLTAAGRWLVFFQELIKGGAGTMAGALQTWSPFRQMERFRREVDELFDRFMSGATDTGRWLRDRWHPAIESFVEGDTMVVRADLPGIDPGKVEVTVNGDLLTISGSREAAKEEKDRDYMYREVTYGSFERTLQLPSGIDRDQIKASYSNGVLELRMPLPREMVSRKVPIEIEHKK